MVDTKVSGLTQVASVATTDLISISQDQGGEVYLNGSRKITVGDFKKSNVVSESTTYTVNISNDIILANAFSSTFTVNLPAVVSSKGFHVFHGYNSDTERWL